MTVSFLAVALIAETSAAMPSAGFRTAALSPDEKVIESTNYRNLLKPALGMSRC